MFCNLMILHADCSACVLLRPYFAIFAAPYITRPVVGKRTLQHEPEPPACALLGQHTSSVYELGPCIYIVSPLCLLVPFPRLAALTDVLMHLLCVGLHQPSLQLQFCAPLLVLQLSPWWDPDFLCSATTYSSVFPLGAMPSCLYQLYLGCDHPENEHWNTQQAQQ